VTYYASQPIADYFSLPAQLINEVVAIDYGSFGYQADHRGPNGAAYQLRTFFILAHSPALFLMPLEKLAQFFKRAMAQGYELRRTGGSETQVTVGFARPVLRNHVAHISKPSSALFSKRPEQRAFSTRD